MVKRYFRLGLLGLLGYTSYLFAESKSFVPIMMDDLVIMVPYIKKDKGPDLEIMKTELVDKNGNPITSSHKYEAGEHVFVKMKVKNVGDQQIPDRDEYLMTITLDGSSHSNSVFIPELVNLSPNEIVTFIVETTETLENEDDNKDVIINININKSIFDDDFWKANLFKEKNKKNNTSNTLKIFVYQTDITVQDLSVKVLDSDYNIIRDTNNIDISEDNIDGNYAAFCTKVNNIGAHKIKHTFWRDEMIFRTGSIGNWWLIMNSVSIAPHVVSNNICIALPLPKNLEAGTYTYTLDASQYNDLDNTNNTDSISYTIKK